MNAGVSGTPTVYIDGKHYNGSLDAAAMKAILDQELHPAPAANASKAPPAQQRHLSSQMTR